MAHRLVVSYFPYLQNSASSFENTVIFRPETMFLHCCLPSFKNTENRSPPQDAPFKAA
jgi:hypothetical protein